MGVTISQPNNIETIKGNSLAIFKDASTEKFFAKDVNGAIENISDAIGVPQTLQDVLDAGNTATSNINLSGRVDASQVRIEGNPRPLVLTKTTNTDSHIALITTGESDAYIMSKDGHIGIGSTNGYSTNNINIQKGLGYLGIKERNPQAPLHIKNNGEAIRLESTGNNVCSIDFTQGTNKRGSIEYSNINDTLEITTKNPTGTNSEIKFSTADGIGADAQEVMRIKNQQVVIGNPNNVPSTAELYVNGRIEATNNLILGSNALISGNVGIGTDNPQQKLDVNGSILASGSTTIGGDLTVTGGDITLGGTGRIQGIDTVTDSTDAVNKEYVDNTFVTGVTTSDGITGGGVSGGVVNIALDSDLRGHAWFIGRDLNDCININTTDIEFALNGSLEMKLFSNGDLHVDGDVVAYSTSVSDIRLKENVKTIEGALDKVEKLRGVEYDWKKGNRKGQHEIGVIAQEVEEVFPFLVHEHELATGDFENDDTVYKTVDYEKLVGVLIESVKELSAKVKTLESKLQ